MTPEMMPYISLAGLFMVFCGFAVTIGTMIFYGGKFTEQHKQHGTRLGDLEDEMYRNDGIKDRVTIHHQILTGGER